jgi:23S rRNA (uridine2552-2'-O)-methyltransferase
LRLHEARKDLYRRLAKDQGYKSRAAFKLKQANSKYGLIQERDIVIDFGAAPGGWLQVASELSGESGHVVGIDVRHIKKLAPNVRTLNADAFDDRIAESILSLTHRKADVILSDLAPSVTGTWELDHYRQVELTFRVLALAPVLLRPGGNVFMKVFDGERLAEVRDTVRKLFRFTSLTKPDASRKESSEVYVVGLGFRVEPVQA